jgi:hypothetical protein
MSTAVGDARKWNIFSIKTQDMVSIKKTGKLKSFFLMLSSDDWHSL